TAGLIALFASPAEFESQLDKLFTIPWNPQHIARNISVFIGQYCHGNQPDHSFPYLYTFVGKQEKSQQRINEIMDRLYGMGEYGLAMCGMDDAGEMSAWYVYAAMGFYPYSPADPSYIISVPVFDKIEMQVENNTFTIVKKNNGMKITRVTCDNEAIKGYFLGHDNLLNNKELLIETE
ncbi:MAG: glycoside hydrolase family 92 protein, partial [Sedimentisphaerales bacterium]|nr:glycoside hydrolase family 92 protein [Sedimentisphaerales bacterium]